MKAFRFFLPISLLVVLLAYQEYRHQQFIQEMNASLTTSRVQLEDIIQETEGEFRRMMDPPYRKKFRPVYTTYLAISGSIDSIHSQIEVYSTGTDSTPLSLENWKTLQTQFNHLQEEIDCLFQDLVYEHGEDLGLINNELDGLIQYFKFKVDLFHLPKIHRVSSESFQKVNGTLILSIADQKLRNIQWEVLQLSKGFVGGKKLSCFPFLIPVVQPFASYYAPGDTFRAMISIDHYFAHGYNPEKIRYFVNDQLVPIGKSSGTAAYYEFYPMPKENIDLTIRVEYYDEIDQKWQEPFLGAYTYTLRSQLPMTNHYQSVSPPKETITPYGMD